MDPLILNAYCYSSRLAGMFGFDALENEFLKALHQIQGEFCRVFPISPRRLQTKRHCLTEEASP